MPITLSSLKNGLAALKNDTQPLIDKLKTKLTSGILITDEEEKWLDHEANFTDETLLLAELQHAMDFQSALDSLSNNHKAIAQCMQAASGVEGQNLGMVANVVQCESNPNLKCECCDGWRNLHSKYSQALKELFQTQMKNHQQRSSQSLLIKKLPHCNSASRS
ncbi:uncharacterized protein EI90DRAFT_3013808 [Cantharellus anzutake]|uniref:uncharacterized protein n=1 Tax=Cantharellus anzutake TaxID=1750568 RepID=UPI001907EEAB|nr:uncharacterized protein EI90DRAFT_3013808 [Cantharellus anzutake]KAF8337640.1 hypothetical protein EI90DRAFT_3013808 [Cantharellus anzutake]